ncbi:MAG: hypothetical protein JNM78_05895, partial [Cyclobacteriaceae bacterium]|nr:hypothetical protein [Cyclobacteriaceae bacterium]
MREAAFNTAKPIYRSLVLSLILILLQGSLWAATITSAGTGNWNVGASWVGGVAPGPGDNAIIANGHNISIVAAQTVIAVTVNSGGTLTMAVGGSLTVTTMTVNGGGTYVHNQNGGTIPNATWAASSNLNITGVTNAVPGGFTQTFGNVTWNSSSQSTNIYLQSDVTIQGDFSVLDTGLPLDPTNRALRMSNTAAANTINVGGNMIITNSTFKMNNSTGSCTLNVGGNLNLNSGNFTIVTGGANSSVSVTGDVNILSGTLEMQEDGSASIGTLNVTGNFTNTGGAVTESGGGTGQIVFNRAGTQIFTSGGSISNQVNITVIGGTTLQMAAAGTIVGGNDFTLSNGSTLGIRSTAGITTAGATGNIQGTGTRTYSSSANYIYNGSANQSVGNGLPATVSNLTIANTGGGGNNTVILVADVGITNGLDINSGVLAMGASNITTVGSVSMTGTSITGTGTLTLAGNVTTVLSGTTASINAPIALGAASRTFTVPDGGASPDLTLSAVISGAGGIIKNGAGLINVFGANSYTGLTTVNAGTYRIGSASALGSTAAGTVVATGAALDFNGINYVLAEPLTINGTGISSGGSIFNGNASGASFSGSITLASASSIVSTNPITLSGAISGVFDLTKGGASTLTFGSTPVTISGLTIGSGTLVSTSGTLSLSGVFINSGTFSNNGGTVHYNGSSQTIAPVTYNHLDVNQSSGQASLGGSTNVNGVLTLTNGALNLNTFDLNLGSTATISVAGPSATKMIIASTGSQVIKTYNGIGSFTFPIGDNTGTVEYSPITVNVTAGSGFPANVGISVFDAKHPNNSSTTNFLTRYWQINSTITGGIATISGTYLPVDISGTEASVVAAQLTGVFNQSSNPWVKYGVLGANTLTTTAAPLTLGQSNIFSGITGSNPTATIVGGGVSICVGSSVNLSTNVTGDPTFSYNWSPAAGLSATNISNPVATPAITTIYTVTVTDGNGQVASDNTTITVNAYPIDKAVSPITATTICNGATISLRITASESGINYEVQDQANNPVSIVVGGTGSDLDIVTNALTPGVTSLKVVATNATTLCSLTLSSVISPVTVNAIPSTPTINPVGPVVVCEGSAGIVLTSSAGAGNQWYKDGTPIG